MNRRMTTLTGVLMMAIVCASPNLMAQKKARSSAKQVNDSNTPLHLLQPDYKVPYLIPTQESISNTLESVLSFLDAATPAKLIDGSTQQEITDYSTINAESRIQPGAFRLTSYEWGVTYLGMLAAGEATGNKAFTDYTLNRFRFLATVAPSFKQLAEQGKPIDGQMRQMLQPNDLDDCGSMCAAMIRAFRPLMDTNLNPYIENYANHIMTQQYRLRDGTLARKRPIENSVWIDDMFMGLPALARMGSHTGKAAYYDEASRQYLLFAEKTFVPEAGLFRHAWVEGMTHHPSFFWGRANGWALLTAVELLDALPENHYQRKKILAIFRQHAEGLLARQSGEGLWHQLLDRNDSYLETSASAIYCYCFARGINKGWLDAQAFGPATLLAWNAVAQQVTNQGHVMGTCVGTGMAFDAAYYYHRPVNEYAAHGYGPVLLAGAEVINLLNKFYPKMNDSAVQFYTHEIKTQAPIFEEPKRTRERTPGDTRNGKRPVVFTIGDSTVKNGDGSGRNGQWGWGAYLGNYLMADSVTVENYARGGRSSRTYIEEGLWDEVLNALQPGDYVLIQFGHNDGSDPGKGRCRGTLRGNGDESQMFTMESNGQVIDVHSFGWYIRQYINQTLAKGATPIVCSLIPRNRWTEDNKVIRDDKSYALWAKQAVESVSGAYFIDLNQLVCDKYDVLGKAFVANLYYGDHTHTSMAGAQLNASIVAEALKTLDLPISDDVK